jgi:DNA modification methylase
MPVSKPPNTITPYWQSECGRASVYIGKCENIAPLLASEQFHAVVTDPPYELAFMGRKWDSTGIAYSVPMWESILRVAKPGAHLLSFGGTRTWHRVACAVEDAGWEMRDTIMWVYGSGFPKSHDVSKAIDKLYGVSDKREVTSSYDTGIGGITYNGGRGQWNGKITHSEGFTEEAKQWHGWGTALKPAVEPIIVARKPMTDTVAQCVLEHGTGGINVDGCRVGMEARQSMTGGMGRKANPVYGKFARTDVEVIDTNKGRWPANLVHDCSEEVLALFPESKSSSAVMPLPLTPGDSVGEVHGDVGRSTLRGHDDGGSAARFFYSAKADKDDRPHGKDATIHPTVKPLDLMRWLVRLVCVPGGTVLDPFTGSGSTGCAVVLEGMRFVGIEQSQEYADITVGRLKLALAERGSGTPPAPGQVQRADSRPPVPKKLRGT